MRGVPPENSIVLSHDRREVVHFNATEHPTAQWTPQQLIEAFPFKSAPRYLLHDRDAIYGEKVKRRIRSSGIDEVISAPRSPWQKRLCVFPARFLLTLEASCGAEPPIPRSFPWDR